jgi:hypothetical protein
VCKGALCKSVVYLFRFHFELLENPSKLLSQRKFVIYMMLLRKSTVIQIHVTEVNVAILWGYLRAVW